MKLFLSAGVDSKGEAYGGDWEAREGGGTEARGDDGTERDGTDIAAQGGLDPGRSQPCNIHVGPALPDARAALEAGRDSTRRTPTTGGAGPRRGECVPA